MTNQIKEFLDQAVAAVRNKDFQQAEIHCNNVILLNPTIADAYNLLGLIYSEQKEYSKAIAVSRKAILCAPNNLLFQNNLGKLLFLSGKDKEAITVFEKIIKLQPSFYQAHFNLGKYYKKINMWENAKSYFEKVVELQPTFAPALNNLANLLQKEDKWQEALELYEKAVSIHPEFPEIHTNIGHIYTLQKKFELAETAFNTSIQLKPQYWEAHVALGNLYHRTKQFNKAEKAYLNVLAIHTTHTDSFIQLGNIYRMNGDFEKAARMLLKLISLEPKNVIAHINLGLVYFLISDHENARNHFSKALEIDPSNAESKFTLGKLYELDKKYIQSKELYEELLKENHAFNIQVLYELFLLKLRIADWSNYDTLLEQLIEVTANYLQDSKQTYNLTPLTLNYFPVPNALHLGVSKKYAALVLSEVMESKKAAAFSYPKDKHNGKLRIGYLSPDFRLHALGLLLKDVFLNHNRNNVEIYLYSIVNLDDEYNSSFRSSCDVFRDISRLSHLEAATLINQDEVHVLIDLAGYTSHCRPHILAYEPAPLQLSFLGYPNTSGSEYVKYLLGDKHLLPEHLQPFYSEKFIHLEHAFICSPLYIANKYPSKSELGLPEDAFVFCCFNSIYKISPRVFSVWMKVLAATPKSVLWLSKENELAVEHLKKETIKQGIDPSRIIFAERLPMDEYLASYHHADLFLDTFYYSAGSTAACALYAGVPLLTLAGDSNSSRMGASIVDAAGLDSFIVDTENAYIEKAIHFYLHPNECLAAKQKLVNRRSELKLFDLKAFTSDLETKLTELSKNLPFG